jgi:polyphenol oxidase
MSDHTNTKHMRHAAKGGIRRRDLMTGSLAGAFAFGTSPAWAQLGPTIPQHCVPPVPPGQPVAFTPPAANAPVRVRKSAFELSPPEVDKLKSAYAALRNLAQQSPDDPRNWFHQGQVHCWYCSGALDGLWGQEIHGSWWFLPWHRAYLYFHEQVLGNLIGDPTFALPFWDWDTPGRDRFPFDTYGQPNDASNPLGDRSRGVSPSDRLPAGFVGPGMMQRVLGAATFTDFGGSGDQSLGQNQMGILEGGPHGGVHVWTTDPKVDFNNPKPDMGVLASAAFDPVFFAHHANIDRVWDKWIKEPQSKHANPDNQAWLNQSFFFYDQAQNWTFISNNQMLEPEAMSYRYQAPQQQPTPAVVAAAAPAGPRPQARLAQLPQLSAPVVDLSRSAGAKALTPDPASVRAAIPQESRQRLNAVGAMAATPGNEQHVILRIEGVEIPSDRGALVHVFVNKPDATAATSTDDPAFAGTIAVVAARAPGSAGHAHPVVRNFGFDITRIASQLGNANDITVTLVPATGSGEKPSAVNLRYNRIYISTRQ